MEDPEISQIHPNPIREEPKTSLSPRNCCCFFTLRIRDRIRTAENENRWWAKGLIPFKKLREWSELVAGPKWKTFIRRLNRNRSGGGSSSGGHGKFQYDPWSYSLNFDEGPWHSGNSNDDGDGDDYGGFRDFSSRYAPLSGKSTAGFGSR